MNKFIEFLLTVAGGTAVVVIVAATVNYAVRWAKRRPRAMGGAAWAFLFLSSGRMPPPPPQEQIEQETREKKNREVDDLDV